MRAPPWLTTVLFAVLAVLLLGETWLAGFAASFGQSQIGARVFMAGAGGLVVGCVLFLMKRRAIAVGVLAATLAATAGMTAWEAWTMRPRPAEAITAQFADYQLNVPEGAACFPSYAWREGANLKLPSTDGTCPALIESVRLEIVKAAQPASFFGPLPERAAIEAATPAPPREALDALMTREERKTLGYFSIGREGWRVTGEAPATLFACDNYSCGAVFQCAGSLATVQWLKSTGSPSEVLPRVRRTMAGWTGGACERR